MPKKNTMVDTAYQSIKNQIISYTLAPNTPVSDNQLALELGMSRAPVREAILQLSSDGLIELNEAGKPVVASIGLNDIIEILRVRRALESEAVRIIAENGWLTIEQEVIFEEIYRQLVELEGGKRPTEHYRYDEAFHTSIIDFSANSRIAKIMERMTLQMQRARWLNIAMPNRAQQANEEHAQIYQALRSRDLQGAINATQQHIDNSESTFRQVFEDPNLKQIMAGIYSFFYY